MMTLAGSYLTFNSVTVDILVILVVVIMLERLTVPLWQFAGSPTYRSWLHYLLLQLDESLKLKLKLKYIVDSAWNCILVQTRHQNNWWSICCVFPTLWIWYSFWIYDHQVRDGSTYSVNPGPTNLQHFGILLIGHQLSTKTVSHLISSLFYSLYEYCNFQLVWEVLGRFIVVNCRFIHSISFPGLYSLLQAWITEELRYPNLD